MLILLFLYLLNSEQDELIHSWLRNKITYCKIGMPLEDLHNFIRKNFEFPGRILTAHDTLSYAKSILPRAVPDIKETEDHQMYTFQQSTDL